MAITVTVFRSALVVGADLICSTSSDISKYLVCLVSFQPSFQVISPRVHFVLSR
jgi:hypothetical protein